MLAAAQYSGATRLQGGAAAQYSCATGLQGRQRRYYCAIGLQGGQQHRYSTPPECYCIIKHEDEEFIEEYDYYLFRATSEPHRLKKTTVDSYGQVFPGDSWVIKGNYFTLAENNHGESIDQGHGLYVWSKRTAIAWAASVMSSGLELHEAGDEDSASG
jgi:hypothetical protein